MHSRLLAILLLVLLLAGCAAQDYRRRAASEPVRCPGGSEWPRTGDAAWLRGRLARAGLPITACTGTAYVVRLPSGTEAYVWAFGPLRGSGPLEGERSWVRETAGRRVYGNRVRAVWVAGGRYVWVQAGPTAEKLPSLDELSPLVAATVR
jgi:hypothetical protein